MILDKSLQIPAWLLKFDFLPRLFFGLAILLGTLFITRLMYRAIATLPTTANRLRSLQFYRYFKWMLWALAIQLASQQFGIRLEFLDKVLLITLSVIFGSLGLTFSLASYQSIHGVILAHFYKKDIPIGATILVGTQTGRVIEWTAYALQIQTETGRTCIPVGLLEKSGYTIVRKDLLHDKLD